MRLDTKNAEKIMCGAVSIKEQNGRFVLYRFTDDELAVESNSNVHYSSGARLSFKTDATAVRVKICVKNLAIRECFSLDIYCDGSISGSLSNCDGTLECFAEKNYPLGEFSGEFPLSDGEKTVDILLPYSVKCEIEYIELENASFVTPVKRKKKLLAYGDSITQGYDALHPRNTYAMRLADALDAELYNKGLGGAPFCPHLVKAENGVDNPDYITVAYGTNDWGGRDAETLKRNCEGFLKELHQKYPHIPTLVLTPIWRADIDTPKKAGTYADVEKIIEDACKKYKNMTLVHGLELVPPDSSLFGDKRVHPNDHGFMYYAEGLKKYFNN